MQAGERNFHKDDGGPNFMHLASFVQIKKVSPFMKTTSKAYGMDDGNVLTYPLLVV
jgi:hypothetical protein